MTSLPHRMRAAAETLEEVSALYGYHHPHHARWSAWDLRTEAKHVQHPNPAGLYDINCSGHVYTGDDTA